MQQKDRPTSDHKPGRRAPRKTQFCLESSLLHGKLTRRKHVHDAKHCRPSKSATLSSQRCWQRYTFAFGCARATSSNAGTASTDQTATNQLTGTPTLRLPKSCTRLATRVTTVRRQPKGCRHLETKWQYREASTCLFSCHVRGTLISQRAGCGSSPRPCFWSSCCRKTHVRG